MSIEFAAVDMETSDNCNEDYLEIRENDDTGKLLDVICGKSEISKIFTSDGSIWMKFHSNKDITGSGFLAKYTYGMLETILAALLNDSIKPLHCDFREFG